MKRLMAVMAILMLVASIISCGGDGGSSDSSSPDIRVNGPTPELGFPFEDTQYLVGITGQLMPYGPVASDELNIDFDMLMDRVETEDVNNVRMKKVISPCDGKVTLVTEMINDDSPSPETAYMLLVIVEYNENWLIALMFEPMVSLEALQTKQLDMISVTQGQTVTKGQEIGYHIIGASGGPGGYPPHLSYGIIKKNASDGIPQDSGDCSVNDLNDLPTWVCPYEYSSTEAKALFDQVAQQETTPFGCKCTCNLVDCGDSCTFLNK